jgi:CheY-like chemotaxis protein
MHESRLTGKTILIADDEPCLLELLVEQFELLGATVLSAENGRIAFELFESNSVDLVLSDVMMPGGNGIDFLNRVRDDKKSRVPFFFMTAFIHNPNAVDPRFKGADEVFAKPFKLDHLKSAISIALNNCS